jgi:hypothetical protein
MNRKQKMANAVSTLAKIIPNPLEYIGLDEKMVGPEGLEPPTKRL